MDKIPTKKCPQCLAEVPNKAKRCSHCGSKLSQSTSVITKIIAAFFALMFFWVIIVTNMSGGSSSGSQQVKQPDYGLSARAYSQVYVERTLKAPATATFCRGTATDLGDNKWNVSSCVDSENSFGAMVRSNWEAIMIYTGGDPDDIGSWKAEKVIVDGKVVYGE